MCPLSRDQGEKSRDAMRRSKFLTLRYLKSEHTIGQSVENLEIFTTGPLSQNEPFSRYKRLKLKKSRDQATIGSLYSKNALTLVDVKWLKGTMYVLPTLTNYSSGYFESIPRI